MLKKIVFGFVAAASAAACIDLVAIMVTQGLDEAGLWAAPLGALASVVCAWAAVRALRPQSPPMLLPPEPPLPEGVVDRPAELDAVVNALVGSRREMIGITTGLHGAGGLGKTTLALMVCADPRVRRRFGGLVYLVTVGRDVRGPAAVAAKVNDVIKLVASEDATLNRPGTCRTAAGLPTERWPKQVAGP